MSIVGRRERILRPGANLQRMLRVDRSKRFSWKDTIRGSPSVCGARIIFNTGNQAICARLRQRSRGGRFAYFFPAILRRPCKRLNLFLRWMVRIGRCGGFWNLENVPAAKLVVPLDTHRHSRRPLPAIDALHQPGMENGGRHYRGPSRTGPRRPGEIRLFAVSPRMATSAGSTARRVTRRARSAVSAVRGFVVCSPACFRYTASVR